MSLNVGADRDEVSQQTTGYPADHTASQIRLVSSKEPSNSDSHTKHGHAVLFYAGDAFPIDELRRYIGSALESGGASVVIATKAHRDKIARHLRASGLDVGLAVKEGRYVALDAAKTLAKFMRDGWPDTDLFMEVVGGVIKKATLAAGASGRVAAFGEMVAVLWGEGNGRAAIHLEELWNELKKSHSFDLLCGYAMSAFGRADDGAALEEICATHSYVVPAESYRSLVNDQESARAVILLQQKTLALEAEIEERKKVQRTLERREAELSDFFENAAVALHWVGPEGTVLSVNQTELELLGYSRDEFVGQHIERFHADQEVIKDILDRLAKGESLLDYEARLLCKDGSIKHVLINSNAFWENGKFMHSRCVTRDITQSKQTEAALRASEARFRTMADTVPVMVWVSDTNKQRTYFNRWWSEFTGCAVERDLGYGWTEHLHPDDLKRYMDLYESSFDAGTEFKIEYRLKRFDGIYRWVLSHGVPFFSQDGAFAGFIGSSMDITERVELEDRKDAFIALASHELKTPITSLKIFTQLLKKRIEKADNGESDLVKQFVRMDAQLDKLTALVRSLLDVSNIQAGKLDYAMEKVALDDIAAEVVDEIQRISSTHTIELDAGAGVMVDADRDRIRQVLTNLLMNAIKFSPKADRVIVRSSLDEERREVTVSVEDFGIGIPRSEKDKVFDRFFQVSQVNNATDSGEIGSPHTDTYPGLGLGLYISSEIVARHGGRIWVESAIGQGSTFYFTLPV